MDTMAYTIIGLAVFIAFFVMLNGIYKNSKEQIRLLEIIAENTTKNAIISENSVNDPKVLEALLKSKKPDEPKKDDSDRNVEKSYIQ